MSNKLKDYIIMETKELCNILSELACRFSDNEFIEADIVVKSDRLWLENWSCGMVSSPALRFIVEYCDARHLYFYVDFDSQRVIIHG